MYIRISIFTLSLLTICHAAQHTANHKHGENCNHSEHQTHSGDIKLDLSGTVDMYYHTDDSNEGISHLTEEISGFSHITTVRSIITERMKASISDTWNCSSQPR